MFKINCLIKSMIHKYIPQCCLQVAVRVHRSTIPDTVLRSLADTMRQQPVHYFYAISKTQPVYKRLPVGHCQRSGSAYLGFPSTWQPSCTCWPISIRLPAWNGGCAWICWKLSWIIRAAAERTTINFASRQSWLTVRIDLYRLWCRHVYIGIQSIIRLTLNWLTDHFSADSHVSTVATDCLSIF